MGHVGVQDDTEKSTFAKLHKTLVFVLLMLGLVLSGIVGWHLVFEVVVGV